MIESTAVASGSAYSLENDYYDAGACRHLVAAVIHQAVKEAKDNNDSALSWLRGDQCRFYMDSLGWDRQAILEVVEC